MSDHLLIGAAARFEVGLCRVKLGDGVGAARLGLRHVGARHLAHIEPILGLFELLGQDIDV